MGTAPASKKPANAPKELDLSNVPDRLRTTAILILTLSERTKLKDDEVKLLLQLLKKHYPKRIDREIELQAQNFRKDGRNMHSLQVFLINTILQNQRTRPLPKEEASATPVEVADTLTDPRTAAIVKAVTGKKKCTRGNGKAVTQTPNTDDVAEW